MASTLPYRLWSDNHGKNGHYGVGMFDPVKRFGKHRDKARQDTGIRLTRSAGIF